MTMRDSGNNNNNNTLPTYDTSSNNPTNGSKKLNTLCTCSNSADGTMTITIKRRSIKWCALLFVFFVSLFNIIPLLNQLPSTFIALMETVDLDTAELEPEQLLPEETFGPEGWSDVKLLIYMTTHLPEAHVAFLPCWKDAAQRMDIFKYADLMLYTAADPTEEQLEQLPFRHTMIKRYENPGYQEGAVQAVVDPYLDNSTWFDDYDWVIRVNPDVLIRDDKWLIETMLNTSVDVIVHDCTSENKYTDHPHFHTDFFAFRPKAIDRDILLQAGRGHAESHFTDVVRHLYEAGRYAYVEGGKNEFEGICRIAGVNSPVLHVHELSQFCPDYYNVTDGVVYR